MVTDASDVVSVTKKLRPDIVLISDDAKPAAVVGAITEVMVECPTPVLIVSMSGAAEPTETSLLGLRAGALSVLRFPTQDDKARRTRIEQEFVATIRAMAQVKLVRRWRQRQLSAPQTPKRPKGPCHVIAIAASTGGPAALKTILDALPQDFPAPILIVQHIANGFVSGVAEWLDQSSALNVRMAQDGERLQSGTAYVAPDNLHLGVSNRSSLGLSDDAPIEGFRPSATYLFESVAKSFENSAIGVILTGMGQDGLDGLMKLGAAGGQIIAQNEASSVVFGMPGVAIRQGLASQILAPENIAQALIDACKSRTLHGPDSCR